MKKLYTFISAVILSASLWAQAPQKMSYQAVIRGANNTLVVEKQVGVKISILQNSETGSVVYTETHTPTTNTNGLASLSIGAGKSPSSDFSKIDWSKGPYFVKIETDVVGGTNYQLTSVSELMSVPYALNSRESGNGIKSVSKTGDTLNLNNGSFVIIPGISAAQPKPTSGYGPNINDVDGNTYKTVYLGTQQWMAENLKTIKFNDGTFIKFIIDGSEWQNNNTGAYSFYDNDDSNIFTNGLLYNWYAISPTSNGNKNVCPSGWHVPTDNEWTILTDYLGGENIAGGKMKEIGTINWNSPNTDATNTSNFTGIPSGCRNTNGNFYHIKNNAYWWSSTSSSTTNAWYRNLFNINGSANRANVSKADGFSIRCLKD